MLQTLLRPAAQAFSHAWPRPMPGVWLAAALALGAAPAGAATETAAAPAASAPAAPAIAPEVYAPIAMEEGTWDAELTFYQDDKPAGEGKGVQVNVLLHNGHWITNDFRVPSNGKFPAYQGHGVWGYDPVAKTYVNTWVDTNDASVRTDYGYWQAKEQTMVWSSKQSDGKGHFIDYRFVEEFRGNTRLFAVYQLGLVKPNPHPLVKIVFTRRAGAASAS